MSYAITWSELALADIEEIGTYLRREASAERADYVVEARYEQVNTLANAPYAFPVAQRRLYRGRQFRMLPKWNYVIHYAVSESESLIRVVAVEHAHRDT